MYVVLRAQIRILQMTGRYIFFFVIIGCFFNTSLAFNHNEIEQFTTDDGLPSNTVLGIAQDQLGRIWFATYDGLCFYDGFGFHTVRPFDGLTKEPLALGSIMDVKVDSLGNVWALFENNHLIRLLGDQGMCKLYPQYFDSKYAALSLFVDSSGTFSFNYNEHRYRYDSKKDSFAEEGQFVPGSLSSEKDSIENGLAEIDPLAELFSYSFSPDQVHVWIATRNKGIYFIPNRNFGLAVHYHQDAALPYNIPNNEVYCVLEDRLGNVWAGTKDAGVCVAFNKENQFTYIPDYSGSENPVQSSVRSIFQESNGKLWVGTYNSGILVSKGDGFEKLDLSQGSRSKEWNWIRCIYQTRDQFIWVGTYGGLCRIDPVTKEKKYWPFGKGNQFPTNGRIYSIAEGHNGNLFLGEWGSLDYFDRSSGNFTSLDTLTELKGANIRKLYLQQEKHLWIGTEGQGVYVLNTENHQIEQHYFVEATAGNRLVTNSIFDIYEDQAGSIWVACFGGLNCIDREGKIQDYGWLNQKILSGIIYRIFRDDKKELWCSTPKGLLKICLETHELRIYDREDIDLISEYSEGAAFQSPKGDLFFGGSNGVVNFHPDSLKISLNVPTILLESVSMNGKQIDDVAYSRDCDSVFTFNSWENNLSVALKAIQVNTPHKSKIAYKLFPEDKHFRIFEGAIRQIDYLKLPPGKYRLLVKTANADNRWSAPSPVFDFSIGKPFWMEIYFWIVMLAGFGVAVIVYSRLRIRKIRKENLKLEAKVAKRTKKIERQKRQLQEINHSLEEKNAEVAAQRDQILAQRDHLLEMHQKLEELNLIKEQFYMNISHDIRTPLSLMKMPLSELIKSPLLPGEFRPKLEQIQRNSEYVVKLLEQVLDKRKLETGGLQLVYTQGDVVDICYSVFKQFTEQAKMNGLDFQFLCDEKEYQCRYDFDKLQQIVFNLLANALKFTPEGGRIHCQLKVNETELEVVVADNGIGIPADRIQLIFERYYQVGKSVPGKNSGSGIGLSLVNDFAKLLGGQVSVESLAGEGSTFQVHLPLFRPLSGSESGLAESDSTEVPNQAGERILLVEDHDEFREYMKGLLSSSYTVVACKNGMEAIRFLNKQGGIKLILSDWMMPELDGIEFCKLVRKDSRYQNTPFIILTALNQNENRKEALLAGVDDFITKPFDAELLDMKLSNLLNRDQRLIKAVSVDLAIQPEDEKVETFDDRFLIRLKSVVEKRLSDPDFGQAELASELGMSTMQFYRKLKDLVQMTPTDFIRSVRIKRSKQLLIKEGMTINEISDQVGFNDPKYFSRCFIREAGMSPSKYRELQAESVDPSSI